MKSTLAILLDDQVQSRCDLLANGIDRKVQPRIEREGLQSPHRVIGRRRMQHRTTPTVPAVERLQKVHGLRAANFTQQDARRSHPTDSRMSGSSLSQGSP